MSAQVHALKAINTRVEAPEEGTALFGPVPFKVYTQRDLDRIPQLARLSPAQRFEMKVVSSVLPFRVNQYVIDELIDWANVPADPIFQLTFPQRGMLAPEHYERIAELIRAEAPKDELERAIDAVRHALNPHPADQMAMNMPRDEHGKRLDGMQHKYRETVLFFPSQGQTCHSYCTFCFRWAQFVGDKELRIASSEASALHDYLRKHTEVTDLQVTGGGLLYPSDAADDRLCGTYGGGRVITNNMQ